MLVKLKIIITCLLALLLLVGNASAIDSKKNNNTKKILSTKKTSVKKPVIYKAKPYKAKKKNAPLVYKKPAAKVKYVKKSARSKKILTKPAKSYKQIRSSKASRSKVYYQKGALQLDSIAAIPEFIPRNLKPNELQKIDFKIAGENVILDTFPHLDLQYDGKSAAISNHNEFIFFPAVPALQQYADSIVRQSRADHVALVVMEPKTGRILAISQKSSTIANPSLHAGFPAASIFKVVTTAAGIESGKISSGTIIQFRGGDYTLDRWNYNPDSRRDHRAMSITEALGKSCNPVFGRIAYNFLSPELLYKYAQRFGFNKEMGLNYVLEPSSAQIPVDDFGFSRTAAGFGKVYLSPIHAASLMSSIANGGSLMKPILVDSIINQSGDVIYQSTPQKIQQALMPDTSKELLSMMEATTLHGTSRREFTRYGMRVLPYRVAAKTGTLNGTNPKGLNQWFIAAAPIENPQVVIAVITVNKQDGRSSPAHLGRLMIERVMGHQNSRVNG